MLSSCNTCLHLTMETNTVDPTCTQSGKTTVTCVDCQYSYVDEIFEPIGHSYDPWITEPTCETGGYTTYICSVCDHSYVSDHTAALGHTFDELLVAPTCTEQGYVFHQCSNCDYSFIDNVQQPSGHSFLYSSVITKPTCTSEGYTTYKCDMCEYSYESDYKAVLPHNFEEVVTPATCTDQGYTTYSCEDCEYSFISDFVEPWGHDFKFSAHVTEPTCTEMGYTTYYCASCDYKHVSDYVEPLGHEFDEENAIIEHPSCTEAGYTTYYCSHCAFYYTADYIKPAGHIYTEEILTAPTCTEIGSSKYACGCGDSYTVTTAATGHDFERSVHMPTLSDMGYTEYYCVNCTYEYTGDYRFYKDILPNGAYSDNSEVMAQGIDISEYNYDGIDAIDFVALKEAGIDYVIIKAGSSYRDGYTRGGIDPRFEQSYADAKAAGLDVGVYFYTYARSVDEIIFDAELLLTILDGKLFEYPVYLDLEDDSLADLSAATLTEMCVEFFTIMQRAGYYTGLYVNNEWLNNKIQTSEALQKFEIWYARYPDEPIETETEAETDGNISEPTWNEYEYGAHLGMWQYSDNGSFDAIPDVPFDLNYAYKDYPTLIKNGGFNGYEADVYFYDDGKEFVYIIANAVNVRSTPDFDSSVNIIGTAYKGARFEVLEKNPGYTKIRYQGSIAFLGVNPNYFSFEMPTP